MTLFSAWRTSVLLCLLAGLVTFWAIADVARAVAPANTAPPTISPGGTVGPGATLTEVHGTWNPAPASYTYQWMACSVTCAAISGATAQTYVAQPGDVGKTIEVQETANDSSVPPAASAPATSLQTSPVVPSLPANTAVPTISGIAQQGQALTAGTGTWTNTPTSYAYQWDGCSGTTCTAISGATGSTYAVSSTDVGRTIRVMVTATNAGGSSQAAPSSPTATVVPPAPTSTSAPSITGTPQQGSVLTVQHGGWSNNPTSITDQWFRCNGAGGSCAAITGAVAQTYSLSAADVGATILALETAANTGGNGTAYSALTGLITTPAGTVPIPVSVSLVATPGAPMTNQTVTLVATVSSGSGNAAPSGSLTFFNGTSPISGCANKGFRAVGQSISLICQSSLPAGSASFTAVYTPTAGSPLQTSASSVTTLDVGKDSTATSLAVIKHVAPGQRATYTATIGLPVSNSGPIQPTGSIEFLDGGRPIPGCLSRALNQLTATCAVKYRSLGKHHITAQYAGDANFMPSASPTRLVQIVRTSSGPTVLGFISSTLQWQFNYHPSYTQVTTLRADRVVKGITVLVTCAGRGCPFSRLSLPTKTSTSIDLLPAFRTRHLRVGSQITLRIMRQHWIGKYYSFTIRGGRGPLIVLSCLGVSSNRPGAGC